MFVEIGSRSGGGGSYFGDTGDGDRYDPPKHSGSEMDLLIHLFAGFNAFMLLFAAASAGLSKSSVEAVVFLGYFALFGAFFARKALQILNDNLPSPF